MDQHSKENPFKKRKSCPAALCWALVKKWSSMRVTDLRAARTNFSRACSFIKSCQALLWCVHDKTILVRFNHNKKFRSLTTLKGFVLNILIYNFYAAFFYRHKNVALLVSNDERFPVKGKKKDILPNCFWHLYNYDGWSQVKQCAISCCYLMAPLFWKIHRAPGWI